MNALKKQIYEQILQIDPENIDGLNSCAMCIKNIFAPQKIDYFDICYQLYSKALKVSSLN